MILSRARGAGSPFTKAGQAWHATIYKENAMINMTYKTDCVNHVIYKGARVRRELSVPWLFIHAVMLYWKDLLLYHVYHCTLAWRQNPLSLCNYVEEMRLQQTNMGLVTWSYMTHVTRKQTLRSLSLSYFWYDIDFSEFDFADIIDYILEKSVSYRAHPSFGMTTTKT